MARPDLPDLSGLTVLVVDDNDDNLDMLSTYLRACAADVLPARDALRGLAHVDSAPRIDAIVTDVSMPRIDGVEFVQRLRQRPRGQSIPVIALTGFHERYLSTHRAWFSAFLPKPVNFDELCATIRALARR